jgi:hypothetical protein
MTLTALIVVNALLAGTVVLGMVFFLGSAIRGDRQTIRTHETSLQNAFEDASSDRLAA